ncbi:MAG: ribulose 1,5-bisphosphate carboxylase [Caldilineaceae bacterium]
MNVLFGNTSLQPTVQAWDMTLPPEMLATFGGPRFGMAGLRRTGQRAHASTDRDGAQAHGPQSGRVGRPVAPPWPGAASTSSRTTTGWPTRPFRLSMNACAPARTRSTGCAETGHRAIYVPNMAGTPSALFRQAEIVHELGVGAVMVSPMLVGLPVFHELVATISRAGAGPSRVRRRAAHRARVAAGQDLPLFGADAVIFPNYGGRFSYSQATCTQLADNMRGPWGELRPAIPSPAGGMKVDRVQEMIDFYGNDVMLLIGGSLLVADDIEAQARTFVENVHAAGGSGHE